MLHKRLHCFVKCTKISLKLEKEVLKMNCVQPIRDKEKIEQMKTELQKNGTRDYLIFCLGINTGLRISDIIKLKVKDILNQDRTIKTHIDIIEEKTSKKKRFKINNSLVEDLKNYIGNMNFEEYIFKSRKGINKPISRVQAYRILNNAGQNVGLDETGTHTLRKTFGYHFYNQTKDVALLQELFNHSSPSITLRYIGINQDKIDQAYDNFSL